MNLTPNKYKVDPRPLNIFYQDIFCGQVGNFSDNFHCPDCKNSVAVVLGDPNPDGWDYVCPDCQKLVVPFEVVSSGEYIRRQISAYPSAVGIIVALPVTLTYSDCRGGE